MAASNSNIADASKLSDASSSSSSSIKDVQENAIATVRRSICQLLDANPTLSPLFLKIAFYDAISYNPTARADGPNGWIRFCKELNDEEKKAIGELDKLKSSSKSVVDPYVSYADLYQLAGIEVVKRAIGPNIDVKFQHGRSDSHIPCKIPMIPEDPDATLVRRTFYGIGFNDKEIVALSSAYYYWMNYAPPPSGSGSTSQQQQQQQQSLHNSYYTQLLEVPTPSLQSPTNATMDQQSSRGTTISTSSTKCWKCLKSDKSFYKHVELFAKDKDAFLKTYAAAHQKLSELGFKQFPEPVPMESDYHDIRHGIAFAVAMTILVGFVGFFYEAMRMN